MRPVGLITADMEVLLEELTDQHCLQKGEILSLVACWIDIHRPNAIEEYEDGSNPELYYGPKRGE